MTAKIEGDMKPDDFFSQAETEYEKENFSLSLELFKKAAGLGDCHAMSRIAIMYDAGLGVVSDIEKSIEWDLKAIAAGSSTSLLNLGITYRRIGNIREAKRLFEIALGNGDGEAALELARLYSVSEKETEAVRKLLGFAISSSDLSADSMDEAQRLLSEI
jgi:TPR repeat protein